MRFGTIFGPYDQQAVEHSAARQLLSEVRLLVDHISSISGMSLSDCTMDDPRNPGTKMTITAILLRLDEVDQTLSRDPNGLPNPADLTFLQLVRDRLGQMIRPASGRTVAYTTLVTEQKSWFRRSRAKTNLARIAYPNLISRAWRHGLYHIAFLTMAIVLTFIAVDLSVEVATGKYILQTLDALHARGTLIAADEMRLESALDNLGNKSLQPAELISSDGSLDIRAFRLCDREKLFAAKASSAKATDEIKTLSMYGSPAEREVCGRDGVLKSDFVTAHRGVDDWVANGAGIVGGVFGLVNGRWGWFASAAPPGSKDAGRNPAAAVVRTGDDIELKIPPTVLANGNYVLPVLFGLLGSLLAVILDYSGKIRRSLLSPSDSWLSWIRLVLGAVVGACIGLFFTAYAPATPPQATAAGAGSELIASLTLSASGLAFLAGFGVEGVFTMLRQLVDRVFGLNQETRPAPDASRSGG